MDEVWQERQEQDNESGIDMHDCWHNHHPLNKLQGEQNDKRERAGNYANAVPRAPNQQAAEAN